MSVHDLAVLGGGPAGVGAAYRAAGRGLDVVLLEREDHLGGAAASIEVAGQRVDQGSHRLHRATDPAILRDLQRLLGSDLQRRVRRGRIRLGGRWVGFPIRPADALVSLPPGMTVRAAFDAVTTPLRRADADTFAAQVRARLGPTMLDRFYGPYANKLWGLAPEDIDGEQFRRRVSADSAASLAARVVRGGRAAAEFLYPRRGFGQISEALGDAARERGAELRLASAVTRLRQVDDGIEVGTEHGDLTATSVLSTLPLPLLARLWEGAPTEVVDHARALDSRAMTLVYLVVASPRYTRFDAHYLPELTTPVTRISEPKNYRDSDDDPADLTVLCAEVPCAVGDDVWTADERSLAALVVDALVGADLPSPPVRDVVVRRLPSAYPIYRRGYADHTAALESWVASLPGLLTFGRQGLFVHDNTHHALAMAYAAVGTLRDDGSIDQAAWAAAREGFRGNVVED